MSRPFPARLAFRLIHAYCIDCNRLIWFWQERCRNSHSACHHAAMRAQYDRVKAAGLPPVRKWTCTACGRLP